MQVIRHYPPLVSSRYVSIVRGALNQCVVQDNSSCVFLLFSNRQLWFHHQAKSSANDDLIDRKDARDSYRERTGGGVIH